MADQRKQTSIEFRAFEATPGLSVVVFPDAPVFTIIAVSDDFVAFTGLTRESLIGKSHFDFFPSSVNDFEAGKANVMASFESVLQHKKPNEIQSQRYDLEIDGKLITKYWTIKNAPVLDESGNVVYIIHTALDITDKVLAELKVESASGIEKAYMFFMQAPVVIGFVRGENYRIELANESLLTVWKVDASVIGKGLFEIFPELEEQGFRTMLDEVRKTGKPYFAYEFPISFEQNGSETTYYFDFVYQPFYEEDSAVAAGVIAIGHDVTSQVLFNKVAAENQRKWKDLANAMPAIVWTAGPDGMVNFLNDRWYELTGRTEEDSLGFAWTQAVHPEDHALALAAWEHARVKEIFYEVELRYKTGSGNFIWAIARGVPIKDNGKVIAWYGTSTDIDQLKKLETDLEKKVLERTSELHEKNKLLDSILVNSSNGISVSELIFNDAGEVTDAQTIMANEAAVNFIGLPRDLYLSKPATYFDPKVIASDYGQACIKTARTGEPFIMRYYLDFSKKWLELTVSRMDERHLIHIFTDVTSIKEAQTKLEKTLEDLRYSNANLEEFAYAASHDLKEPIRKYLFYTNRLREELKDSIQPRHALIIEKLESTSLRMQKLVTDLLEYSQASKGVADYESVNLEDIVKGVLEDLELEVQRNQAKVNTHALPVITGNKRQIQQLFQNLIGNALKYRNPGAAPQINIASTPVKGKDVRHSLPDDIREKDFYLITVRDNGIGFEQKYAERIFNVFTRLHSDLDFRGSGVGLSIVKKVVQGHDGFVWAESEREKGSTFYILLPA